MPKDPLSYHPFKLFFVEQFARILPPCDITCQRLSRAKDEKLSFIEKLLIKLHLINCYWCTNFKIQIDFISDVIQQRLEKSKTEISISKRLNPDSKVRMQKIISDQIDDQN